MERSSHRVLLVGPTAGLAEEFVAAAPPGWSFQAIGRRPPDPTGRPVDPFHPVDARSIGELEYAVRANDCDAVVSFLQVGDRALCERERPAPRELPSGEAWAVNAVATEAVARVAVAEGKRCVVLSTDEVFAGSDRPREETAIPSAWGDQPTWYGATWAEAEEELRRLDGPVAVLRVSALFGWGARPECDRRAAAFLSARASGDGPRVQPTFVPDAVAALGYLVEARETGSFHAAVPASVGREDVARALVPPERAGERLPGGPLERHPGLVPGRLPAAGLRLTPFDEAVRQIRSRRRR